MSNKQSETLSHARAKPTASLAAELAEELKRKITDRKFREVILSQVPCLNPPQSVLSAQEEQVRFLGYCCRFLEVEWYSDKGTPVANDWGKEWEYVVSEAREDPFIHVLKYVKIKEEFSLKNNFKNVKVIKALATAWLEEATEHNAVSWDALAARELVRIPNPGDRHSFIHAVIDTLKVANLSSNNVSFQQIVEDITSEFVKAKIKNVIQHISEENMEDFKQYTPRNLSSLSLDQFKEALTNHVDVLDFLENSDNVKNGIFRVFFKCVCIAFNVSIEVYTSQEFKYEAVVKEFSPVNKAVCGKLELHLDISNKRYEGLMPLRLARLLNDSPLKLDLWLSANNQEEAAIGDVGIDGIVEEADVISSDSSDEDSRERMKEWCYRNSSMAVKKKRKKKSSGHYDDDELLRRAIARASRERERYAKMFKSTKTVPSILMAEKKLRTFNKTVNNHIGNIQFASVNTSGHLLHHGNEVSNERRNDHLKNIKRNDCDSKSLIDKHVKRWTTDCENGDRFNKKFCIRTKFICQLHKTLTKNVLLPKTSVGRLRMTQVQVGKLSFPHHREVPALMEVYCESLNRLIRDRTGDLNMYDIAAYAFLQLIRIHPFKDGNGRTARAMANFILRLFGLPCFVDFAPTKTKKNGLKDAINADIQRENQNESVKSCACHIYQQVRSTLHESTNIEICSICLKPLPEIEENGPAVSLKPCYHKFHHGCIKKWMSISNTCPLCRVVVTHLTNDDGEIEQITVSNSTDSDTESTTEDASTTEISGSDSTESMTTESTTEEDVEEDDHTEEPMETYGDLWYRIENPYCYESDARVRCDTCGYLNCQCTWVPHSTSRNMPSILSIPNRHIPGLNMP